MANNPQTPSVISSQMQRLLERELRPRERLVWSQQPRPAAIARKSFPTFLFGIPFLAFSLFWTFKASSSSHTDKTSWPPWFPLLWGGMFIVGGTCLLLAPVWAWWTALRTVYAITDQRAILIAAPWRHTIHSFVDQHLVDIHRVEDDSGRGDIVFHRQARSGKRGDYYYDTGFLGIERVRETAELLRALYAKTRAA